MKIAIDNYTFDKTAKTVTFTDYGTIRLDRILLIVNETTSNIIIYNLADSTKGGTVATNVLTLTYNTSAMNNTDKLLIYYDDPAITAATGEKQTTGNSSLSNIDTKTPALGQALAAASVPVILPSATITTLTPQTNALTDTQLRASAVPVSLSAGAAIAGKVGIDQTTPGTTDSVSVATGQGAGATIGVTTGAAVITDANGTLQQYLRGIVKLIIAKIGVTIADGDSATMGTTTGAAVITDATGTLQQYLRGLVSYFANVYNATTNFLLVRNLQKDVYANTAAFTITLNSLASSTAGVGRQSTLLTSNTNRAAIVYVKLKMGTSPVINTPLYVYLIQSDGTVFTDNAGASDAGITIVNAKLLGILNCSATTTGAVYGDAFDTRLVTPALGPQWGIAIVQSSGVALDASAGGTIDYVLVS